MSYRTYNLLERSEQDYEPQMAMIVYTNFEREDEVYIECHDIDSKGRLLEGIPLSEECISKLATKFSQEYIVTPYGAVPANMLYFDNRIGHQRYIWFNPPRKRMMYFSKQLNIPNAEYFVPGVIYDVESEHMNIYAFKGENPDDELFKAPFFNTNNGSVCLGTSNLDKPVNSSFNDYINYWEKRFWQTEFTHLGGSRNPTKKNLVHVTKSSLNGFNYDTLVKSHLTLKKLLE